MRLKYVNGVMTFRIWDAFKACACPRKLTVLAFSFGVKVSLNPKVGVQF
jgi:hypothetical protein